MRRPPSAFVFSREYPPVTIGGTSTVARNVSVGLTEEGWRVAVVTTNPSGESDLQDTIAGVTVRRVGTGVVYNQDTGLLDASVRTHRRLHRAAVQLVEEMGPPDAILLPDIVCYPEAALFARTIGRPLVNILLQDFRTLTRHDDGRHSVTSGVSADRRHLFEIEEKSLRGSDHVAFISNALCQAITGYYPDLGTPHSVVYLGVDEAEIASIAAGDADRDQLWASLPLAALHRPLLVGCGRLVPVKGFDVLLRAAALLAARGWQPQVVIIGVGPQRSSLEALAVALGLEDSVTFAGDIPRRAALTWMSMASVAVVPSLWESFCYVCAEMMALGVPVAASAIDSINELMPSEEFGYRVPVTGIDASRVIDPKTLALALEAALSDRAEASQRAQAGRNRILGEFTNARCASALAQLCAGLVGATDHE